MVTTGTTSILPAIAAFGVGYGIYGLNTAVLSALVSVGSAASATIPMLLGSVIMAIIVSIYKLLDYCISTFVKDRFVMLTLFLLCSSIAFTGVGGLYLSYTMFAFRTRSVARFG